MIVIVLEIKNITKNKHKIDSKISSTTHNGNNFRNPKGEVWLLVSFEQSFLLEGLFCSQPIWQL